VLSHKPDKNGPKFSDKKDVTLKMQLGTTVGRFSKDGTEFVFADGKRKLYAKE
jgi:hypothetical protein